MTTTTASKQDIDQLLRELICGNDERAEQAAQALGACGCEVVDALRGTAHSTEPDQRWWTARVLGQFRCEAAQQLLSELLEDAESDVRACAAFSLGEARAESAVQALAQHLKDSSVYVSAMASDALARIGQPSTLVLIDRLKNGTALERSRAAKALLAILDSRSIPALIAALDDESPVVEHYAAEALTRLGVGTVLIKPS